GRFVRDVQKSFFAEFRKMFFEIILKTEFKKIHRVFCALWAKSVASRAFWRRMLAGFSPEKKSFLFAIVASKYCPRPHYLLRAFKHLPRPNATGANSREAPATGVRERRLCSACRAVNVVLGLGKNSVMRTGNVSVWSNMSNTPTMYKI